MTEHDKAVQAEIEQAHKQQLQIMNLLKQQAPPPPSLKKTRRQSGGFIRKAISSAASSAVGKAKDLSVIATSIAMIYKGNSAEALGGFIDKYASESLKKRILSAGDDASKFLNQHELKKGGKRSEGGKLNESKSDKRSESKSDKQSESKSDNRNEDDKQSESESEVKSSKISDKRSEANSSKRSDKRSEAKSRSDSLSRKFVYTGERNEKGEMHGTGRLEYRKGHFYEGEFKNNKRHGKGKITFLDKSSYEGDWSKDEMNGDGKYIYFNGDVYEGGIVEGVRVGFGKMTYANGDVYEGHWKKNRREGEGKMHYKNGDNFVGHWHKDLREGEGRLTDATGKVIEEGEYEGDEPPLDITNATTKIEKVLNSENFVKMKEMLSKFNENMPDVNTSIKYSLYFSHIISAVTMLYSTGGKWCPQGEGAQPLICVTVKTVYESLQGNASIALTSILDSIKTNITTASTSGLEYWKTTLSTLEWFQPIFFGIAVAGFASFLLLILYGTWVYINTPRDDHEKLNKTRRRHR